MPRCYRTSTEAKKAPLGRADIIRKLFGNNMEEYVAAEKRMWEITLKHWDQPMKVMDPYEEPFSVLLPIGGICK
ncbi:MAG: hypothetical protein CMG71_04605 [Candidatus Marinimicrobia bacterium]|nr:hypothetical protein [Candidatus Neomarinimicrobiota bacterium]